MKTILLAILFFPLLIFSKAKYIDSLKINPQLINDQDNAYLIAHTKFPIMPYLFNKDSLKVSIEDTTIIISTYYYSYGGAPINYSRKDTIGLGKLKTGRYKLIFNLRFPAVGSPIPKMYYGQDSINFNVSGVNKVEAIQSQSNVRVYPNPCNHQLFLGNAAGELYELRLFNTEGGETLKKTINGSIPVDVSLLKRGVYFYEIRSLRLQSRKKGKLLLN